MNTKPISLEELTHALDRFSGTEKYHPYREHCVLTDGAKYLAENADCYWLIDYIYEAQSITFLKKAGGMQSWTVCVHQDKSATLVCKNTHNRTIHREVIAHTDFVLGHGEPFQLFADLFYGNHAVVIFLTTEH